ncbi:Bestrophin, RFP-TM, chloride channel-domain-containing protein [Microdochium trichocladiopsis]|uniref:Bestrophin, RFP-TM, chloride channel-domain-containing protein n=1 Tax=Microdochium trichocladiopsis TaxID=1682393 RepID=A0A9P9BNN6_9PEZI|nr:Bestrophin, RFP-TM, chloride channel-domain-containing protein [Microdochium trichocladiopsis]KAH7027926.1 Bestrophin, RFP-TM, chloride channel-domain-containing protein [Microdochium trichocladiopsis]
MSEEGGGHSGPGAASAPANGNAHASAAVQADQPSQINTQKPKEVTYDLNEEDFPTSPQGTQTPNPFSRRQTSIDLDDYFAGPRDISKHSKWPLFMQLHGSIIPKLILPIAFIGLWATCITLIHKKVPYVNLGISNVLLTVTGFVVGLGLSFRSSTAYERYAEGRRYWGTLTLTCHSLARVIWIHGKERPDCTKEDVLSKLTAMNLLVAFAVSLKHKLRFEPYIHYHDLKDLVEHLDTFAEQATNEKLDLVRKKGMFKQVGESLGITFAQSNPRKEMKKATSPLGNLPLEILCYLSAYVDSLVENGQLTVPMQQTTAYNALASLNDVLTGCDRVLNTPLPIAYAIAIQQITWLYVMLLPFQLLPGLEWITIPATIAASAIILSILFIGREIENPFGNDVNDLPLEAFCAQIMEDFEVMAARPKPVWADIVKHPQNKVLFPHSNSSYEVWASRPEGALRRTLRNRPHNAFGGTPGCANTTAEGSLNGEQKVHSENNV